jgi:phage terminase large subunit-like protein
MTADPFAFTDGELAWIAEHDPNLYAEIAAILEAELREERAVRDQSEARRQMSARWGAEARLEQIPPDGTWFVWLILAGRGWGKTRTGAEWAAAMGRRYPGARIALVAPTAADGRDTMIEGESGLLSVIADAELRGGNRDKGWNRSLGELFLANGTRYKVFSAEKPSRLRGPQHHFVWADEPAAWVDAYRGAQASPERDTTWSNLVIGARNKARDDWPTDFQPRIVATTTPKLVRLLKIPDSEAAREPAKSGLMQQSHVTITTGRTDDNLDNLAASYIETVVEPLRGTRLGQQELDAKLLEDVEGALWTHDAEKAAVEGRGLIRRGSLPADGLGRRVLAVDPSDGEEDSDEYAMCVATVDEAGVGYVLHSAGVRLGPRGNVDATAKLYEQWECDVVIVEKNHGGQYLPTMLRDKGLPVKVVTASQGKRTRAEPVAAKYGIGSTGVIHVGDHDELETQLTSYTGAAGEDSPDRLDALVWALTALLIGEGKGRTMRFHGKAA